jgi:hypothetical protein
VQGSIREQQRQKVKAIPRLRAMGADKTLIYGTLYILCAFASFRR